MDSKLRDALLLSAWRAAPRSERERLAQSICDGSGGILQRVRTDDLAVFHHVPLGLLFHLVPGGAFTMGLSDEELAALRAQYQFWNEADEAENVFRWGFMRPTVRVTIAPFLLAAYPLGAEHLARLAAGGTSPERPSKGRVHHTFDGLAAMSAKEYVKYLRSFDEGTMETDAIPLVEANLAGLGLRLPSESEWEFAARAGGQQAFPAGNTIPKTPKTGSNFFGFVDMGADAEVCADGWNPTHEGVSVDGRPRAAATKSRVVRGGAAACYPWQGCAEWAMLLCASRGEDKGLNGSLTVRPAMDLGGIT